MRYREQKRRLDALERDHAGPDWTGAAAAAAARFRAKFSDMIARNEGHTAGPGDSEATQIACLFWSDPAAATIRLQARAQEARAAHAAMMAANKQRGTL